MEAQIGKIRIVLDKKSGFSNNFVVYGVVDILEAASWILRKMITYLMITHLSFKDIIFFYEICLKILKNPNILNHWYSFPYLLG